GAEGEGARNAETPRNRNLAQGWAPENGGGPFGWGVCPIRPSHRGRESGGPCQRLCGACTAAHRKTQCRGGFPEIRPGYPEGKSRSAVSRNSPARSGRGLSRWQDGPIRLGRFASPEAGEASGAFRRIAWGI